MKIHSVDDGRGKAFDHGHAFLPGILKSNALPIQGWPSTNGERMYVYHKSMI
jgi:hypothetical protein